jgi:endonuclease YncB( thermonuclease family)
VTSTTALLCLVVAIADGDTLTARCGGPGAYEQVRVRLAAIDAPERRQPFGNVSRQHLAALCFQVGATITPKSKDRYGRTVADVACRGQDAATEQVRAGLAWVYPKYARGYQRLYDVQATAEDARRGLWADPEPVPPWEWRKASARKP